MTDKYRVQFIDIEGEDHPLLTPSERAELYLRFEECSACYGTGILMLNGTFKTCPVCGGAGGRGVIHDYDNDSDGD